MPEWMKTGAFIFVLMVFWDIIRLFLQAIVNRYVMRGDFQRIEEAVEDIDEEGQTNP